MVVALQQLLNCYVGETLNSFALLIFKGSTTLGAFFFIAERETTAVCHHSCPCIHPLLGFCWDQTERSLWSRQTRDKEVSGRTLASLGIWFTGVEEADTL